VKFKTDPYISETSNFVSNYMVKRIVAFIIFQHFFFFVKNAFHQNENFSEKMKNNFTVDVGSPYFENILNMIFCQFYQNLF
jgi:hypothetical protein